MQDDTGGVSAVHYIYVLKDDEDLKKVWSALAVGTSVAEESFSLDLTSGGHHHGRGCTVIRRAAGDGFGLCLAMLPDLAAIQITYGAGEAASGDATARRWQELLARVEAHRERALGEDVTVMGETTLLVAGEMAAKDLVETGGAVLPAGSLLLTEVDPAIAGGGTPLLAWLLPRDRKSRDYFLLAAGHPEELAGNLLPEADSYIKKLDKAVKYFAHQRQTIVRERLNVDREVSAILHERVVASSDSINPGRLEEEITTLSRMFGVLATDSHLVRKASEKIEKDLHRLEYALSPIRISESGKDEIGDYLANKFNAEFANARIESGNLDFSRENARAAIEVVRTQVDLLRAGEEAALQAQTKEILDRSLLLQEERLALQVAAGFIEFVLVFYYTLKSWEGVAGQELVEHISPILRLLVVSGIAAGASLGTHYLARAIQEKRSNPVVWFAAVLIVLSFIAMVILTITT